MDRSCSALLQLHLFPFLSRPHRHPHPVSQLASCLSRVCLSDCLPHPQTGESFFGFSGRAQSALWLDTHSPNFYCGRFDSRGDGRMFLFWVTIAVDGRNRWFISSDLRAWAEYGRTDNRLYLVPPTRGSPRLLSCICKSGRYLRQSRSTSQHGREKKGQSRVSTIFLKQTKN